MGTRERQNGCCQNKPNAHTNLLLQSDPLALATECKLNPCGFCTLKPKFQVPSAVLPTSAYAPTSPTRKLKADRSPLKTPMATVPLLPLSATFLNYSALKDTCVCPPMSSLPRQPETPIAGPASPQTQQQHLHQPL